MDGVIGRYILAGIGVVIPRMIGLFQARSLGVPKSVIGDVVSGAWGKKKSPIRNIFDRFLVILVSILNSNE